MVKKNKRTGFTFIEVLVVTVIIGVLASVVMVSYAGANKTTRDARRKKDLANLQAALEIYKLNTGSYPDHSTCNASASWPDCLTPWIPGMTDEYVSEMPTDPKQNTASFIANTDTDTYTYNYVRLTETTYRLIARLENADDAAINADQYGYTGDRIYVVPQPR